MPVAGPEINSVLVTCENLDIEVCGHPIRLGARLYCFHPEARVTAAGKKDRSGSTPFHATGVAGTRFVAYLPDRVRTKTDITAWGIAGIDEPPTPVLPAPAQE